MLITLTVFVIWKANSRMGLFCFVCVYDVWCLVGLKMAFDCSQFRSSHGLNASTIDSLINERWFQMPNLRWIPPILLMVRSFVALVCLNGLSGQFTFISSIKNNWFDTGMQLSNCSDLYAPWKIILKKKIAHTHINKYTRTHNEKKNIETNKNRKVL